MLCPIKVKSNTLIVHTSCYWVLVLLCVNIPFKGLDTPFRISSLDHEHALKQFNITKV